MKLFLVQLSLERLPWIADENRYRGPQPKIRQIWGIQWMRVRKDCGNQRGRSHSRTWPTEPTWQKSKGLIETKQAITEPAWVCTRSPENMLRLFNLKFLWDA